MFKYRPTLTAFRGFLLVVGLALLGGCAASNHSAAAGKSSVAAPADVTATPGNTVVGLSWTASSGATGYKVKRATTNGGPYTQVSAPTATSYTDASVTNGTTYYYVVSALDSAGESADSAQVSATPVAPVAIPAIPSGLAATPGNAQVALSWTASSGATGYNVKRGTTNGGPYTQVGAPTSTSYTDTSLTNGTTYYYVVSAINSAGESADSAQVNTTPVASVAIPATPSGLAATPGNAQVALSWTASSGATGYKVKRATASGGPYTQVGAPTSTSYTDTSLTNGTTYYYVVSAINSAGESANSAQISALPVTTTSGPPTFGTWTNVTPSGVNLTGNLSCGNYGTQSVQVDPAHPSNLYAQIHCPGIWKSADYGATWTGPINTGTNGASVSDCAGGIAISPTSTASVPTIYESCIRGSGIGFWKSVDGGVNWIRYVVAPTNRQDYNAPVIDPYDENHLLMSAHEFDSLVESVDGGQTWTSVPLASGMLQNATPQFKTAFVFFINTGNSSTARGTWLWLAQDSGGAFGTWRTSNGGAAWVQVDKNEQPGGASQIYQIGTTGVVYMAGVYSALGWGVLRSQDFGQTWIHVGITHNESVVVATSNDVYAMFGAPVGAGGTTNPVFEVATQPGTGTWVAPGTPAAMTQGSAQIAVIDDGSHNMLIGSMWNGGLWRYIEP
jgi:fibronectin type 3 domain-containing protein